MTNKNKLYAAVAVISLIAATGCATTPSPLEQSTSIDEYFHNAAYAQKDGSKIYDQYAIKALFIKNIIETTNWLDGKKQNLQICIIGDDDFHGKLEKMASLVKQEQGHASLSSLPSSHINALEEGRRNPHINSIFRICCALEIEPYMLLDTIYDEDANGKRICLSNFSIEDNQLSKKEIRKVYDDMVASGKYIPPDKR